MKTVEEIAKTISDNLNYVVKTDYGYRYVGNIIKASEFAKSCVNEDGYSLVKDFDLVCAKGQPKELVEFCLFYFGSREAEISVATICERTGITEGYEAYRITRYLKCNGINYVPESYLN